MIPTTITLNSFVFGFFTIHLAALQFTAGGFEAYFSMYVSKEWMRSGYLLYGALIYLFLVYAMALFRRGQFITGGLQLVSLAMVVGVMLNPFTSVEHIAFLPFLAALQPIILYSDYKEDAWESPHSAIEALWGIAFLAISSPAIFGLMLFPMIEKALIYFVTVLLFASLQRKLHEGSA